MLMKILQRKTFPNMTSQRYVGRLEQVNTTDWFWWSLAEKKEEIF